MRGRISRRWLVLAAAAVVGCDREETPGSSLDTTRTLLQQPRAADVSTAIDTARLGGGEIRLSVDQLGVNMGSVEAPVKVMEFVDFGCGFCRRFQAESFPTIRAEFIDTDMVEWKFVPFVSGMFGNSAVVTEAADCVLPQGGPAYEAFTSALWARQPEWKGSGEPRELVRAWAGELGLDVQALDTCMDTDARLDRVASASALAAQLGVRSTPTFWIVGVGPIQGALPVDVFREVFTRAYEELSGSAG
jgi:protein-disulfide isomerase